VSLPYYVAPEQLMADRADYARKGIARGKSLVGLTYADGVLLVAENPSRSLHKLNEIYDRIAFAGVGKYNEFDQLRVAGVRHADTKGYAYSREDVDAQSLANVYANYLSSVFVHEMKPLEVEILVAEVTDRYGHDAMFHILYDGTIMDEDRFTVLGGESEAIAERVEQGFSDRMTFEAGVKLAVRALSGQERTLKANELEVAVLERANRRRAFRRVSVEELERIIKV
jgi:proteasome alpha subunit